MKKQMVLVLSFGVLVMGGWTWASSDHQKTTLIAPPKVHASARPAAVPRLTVTKRPVVTKVQPQDALAPAGGIALVPPPAELPRVDPSPAPSSAMVASVRPMAVPQPRQAVSVVPAPVIAQKIKPATPPRQSSRPRLRPPAAAAVSRRAAPSRVAATPALASAEKPRCLFSYVRMLNFSPHPQEEEFLRQKPLVLNGKNYWFTVRYLEKWKVLNDDLGSLQSLGFEIKIYEEGKVVRSLRTPPVAVSSKNLKKGMVLGVADVAPYRFFITLDSVLLMKKDISEITFKVDLFG